MLNGGGGGGGRVGSRVVLLLTTWRSRRRVSLYSNKYKTIIGKRLSPFLLPVSGQKSFYFVQFRPKRYLPTEFMIRTAGSPGSELYFRKMKSTWEKKQKSKSTGFPYKISISGRPGLLVVGDLRLHSSRRKKPQSCSQTVCSLEWKSKKKKLQRSNKKMNKTHTKKQQQQKHSKWLRLHFNGGKNNKCARPAAQENHQKSRNQIAGY